MKNKSINMLIVAFLLIALTAVMLIVFLDTSKDEFPKKITVSENGVTESVLPTRDLRLNPTESREYCVNLICAASGKYEITLDYEEKLDGGMKPFIEVTVKADGKTVYEGGLLELLDSDKTISFEGELHEKKPLPITISYHMPRDVGNEAQRTYSDFNVHLKIKKA